MLALKHGYAMIRRAGGMEAVQRHSHYLAQRLAWHLCRLSHSNGRAVCELLSRYDCYRPTKTTEAARGEGDYFNRPELLTKQGEISSAQRRPRPAYPHSPSSPAFRTHRQLSYLVTYPQRTASLSQHLNSALAQLLIGTLPAPRWAVIP